eukprot:gb/GECG01010292.1/.p1 GENE.gb/GECG01010292.1/~~gb/GECG01010292.1/.p1  ORF type:complete len:141 (+),score=15.56 gb/GECG01010292.1/:1-423(+)
MRGAAETGKNGTVQRLGGTPAGRQYKLQNQDNGNAYHALVHLQLAQMGCIDKAQCERTGALVAIKNIHEDCLSRGRGGGNLRYNMHMHRVDTVEDPQKELKIVGCIGGRPHVLGLDDHLQQRQAPPAGQETSLRHPAVCF